jgi:2-oxoglutarate dehydrogenase E1 component
LIVFTPKSLLRHKLAISTLEELAEGSFQTVIPEVDELDSAKVERIVLCSGKVYYDLLQARREREEERIIIVRLEQLYPFPEEQLDEVLAAYTNLESAVWCQEEPMNMGAWYSSQHHMRRVLQEHSSNLSLNYAGREASASPAAGYMALHIEQQEKLINDALDLN